MFTPRFCIHIGLSKTATTTLQNQFFPCHNQIDYLGKYNIHGLGRQRKFKNRQVGSLILQLHSKRLSPRRTSELKGLYDLHVAPLLDPAKLALISSDGISAGYPLNRKRRAENFFKILGPCKIIMVLREPLNLIESLYFQKLKTDNIRKQSFWIKIPTFYTIDQWIEANWKSSITGPMWHIDYFNTIEAFGHVFGKENVGIFLFEELKADPSTFFQNFCGFLGIDAEEGQRLTANRKDNVRWNESHVARLREVVASRSQSLKYRFSSPPQRREILGLSGPVAFQTGEKARAVISDSWRARIKEYTRPGNRTLVDQWGIDLEPYGYPM